MPDTSPLTAINDKLVITASFHLSKKNPSEFTAAKWNDHIKTIHQTSTDPAVTVKKKKSVLRYQLKPYSSTLDLVQIKARVTPGESSSKRRKAMELQSIVLCVAIFHSVHARYTHVFDTC